MQVLHEVCCGLDVHQEKRDGVRGMASGRRRQTREFATFTRDLLELADWLRRCGVTHVALESTGVYWKPVWNLLEGQFEVLLVNAQHIKAVPGRKTDQKDSEWIADLLQHGLLRPSFVPPTPLRELRDLTRYPSESGSGDQPHRQPHRQPHPEGPGRRQHQAGLRGHGCVGGLGPGHAGSDHPWRTGQPAVGGDVPRVAAQQDPGVAAGLARTRHHPSSISASRTARSSLLCGVQNAADRAGDRRATPPFSE